MANRVLPSTWRSFKIRKMMAEKKLFQKDCSSKNEEAYNLKTRTVDFFNSLFTVFNKQKTLKR